MTSQPVASCSESPRSERLKWLRREGFVNLQPSASRTRVFLGNDPTDESVGYDQSCASADSTEITGHLPTCSPMNCSPYTLPRTSLSSKSCQDKLAVACHSNRNNHAQDDWATLYR